MKTYKPFRIEVWVAASSTEPARNGGIFFAWRQALQVLELYPHRSLCIETFYDRKYGRVVQVLVGKPLAAKKAVDIEALEQKLRQMVLDAGMDPDKLVGKTVRVDFKPTEDKLMNKHIERTIVVEGHRLTASAIEKAYQELQAPVRPAGGAVVEVLRGVHKGKNFLVVSDFITRAVEKTYALSLQTDQTRVTNGISTYTFYTVDLLVLRERF